MKSIVVFEDCHYQSFFPFSAIRPVFMMRLGFGTLASRITQVFKGAILSFFCREACAFQVQKEFPTASLNPTPMSGPVHFLNGAVWMTDDLAATLAKADQTQNVIWTYQDRLVAIQAVSEAFVQQVNDFLKNRSQSQQIETLRPLCQEIVLTSCVFMTSLADLISQNTRALSDDFESRKQPDVYVAPDATVEGFVWMDTSHGPIYIDSGAVIKAFSRLEGPLYVGQNSQISGAKLSRSSIGPECRVGGEVSDSIFMAYSNKGHEGFVGHSYIGEWVNLGAMTTTSNLKNTYGMITLESRQGEPPVQAQFLGSFMGDYVKTGIGTLLNAGTVIGTGAVIWGSDLHPRRIPYFAFGTKGNYDRNQFEKVCETATRMMARRGQVFQSSEKELLQTLWMATGEA